MNQLILSGRQWDTLPEAIPVVELECAEGKPYAYQWKLSDLHLGHKEFSKRPFEVALRMLLNHPEYDKTHISMLGDAVELVMTSSFIPEVARQTAMGKWQIQEFVKYMKPFKDRIDVLIAGNHELRLERATKGVLDVADYMKGKIGANHAITASGGRGVYYLIKVSHDGMTEYYPVYDGHGYTSARTKGGVQNQFVYFSRRQVCEVMSMGHTHKRFFTVGKTYYGIVPLGEGYFGKGIFREFWLNTGCYLKDASYTEQKGYGLPDVCCPLLRFWATKHKVDYIDTSYWEGSVDVGLIPSLDLDPIFLEDYPIRRKGIAARPPCPDCGFTHLQSRGSDWKCNTCGRWFRKKK